MRSKFLFLPFSLLCSCAVSLPVAAQEKIAPAQVDPHQLRIIPESTVQEMLSLYKRPVVATASPGPGLPLCVIEGETIVGACPATGISTMVPAVVVPVILNITQGGTAFSFDPTASFPGSRGTVLPSGPAECIPAMQHF